MSLVVVANVVELSCGGCEARADDVTVVGRLHRLAVELATGKFDNIRYDYERHPSGVYDVPASTNTTPACTLVGAPAFSSTKVKVDIEADDEDEYEAFASKATAAPVIVPTQNVVVASKPPIKPRPKLQLLTNPSTVAYAIADVTVDVTKPPFPPPCSHSWAEVVALLRQR